LRRSFLAHFRRFDFPALQRAGAFRQIERRLVGRNQICPANNNRTFLVFMLACANKRIVSLFGTRQLAELWIFISIFVKYRRGGSVSSSFLNDAKIVSA